jgi:hypothetical protein
VSRQGYDPMAPVAQLLRAADFYSEGCGLESHRGHFIDDVQAFLSVPPLDYLAPREIPREPP